MLKSVILASFKTSSVARAFPGWRLAHPESQSEEENEKKFEEK